jgi:hypothetical protein
VVSCSIIDCIWRELQQKFGKGFYMQGFLHARVSTCKGFFHRSIPIPSLANWLTVSPGWDTRRLRETSDHPC